MKPTLLVMAAGMGSRYGWLKQVAWFGPSGEAIIDYSIYDALRTGFGRVVIVVKKEMLHDMEEIFSKKLAPFVTVEYVIQDIGTLPGWFISPPERVKQRGTTHAVLAAKDIIHEPFAVINADDFYGREAFQAVADFLSGPELNETSYTMFNNRLHNMMSEFWYVTRGICQVDEQWYLVGIDETTKVGKEGDAYFHEDDQWIKYPLDRNAIVNTNFRGFHPQVFDFFEKSFLTFLHVHIQDLKAESVMAVLLEDLVKKWTIKIKVLWDDMPRFGITVPQDKQIAIEKLQKMISQWEYPASLWNK